MIDQIEIITNCGNYVIDIDPMRVSSFGVRDPDDGEWRNQVFCAQAECARQYEVASLGAILSRTIKRTHWLQPILGRKKGIR